VAQNIQNSFDASSGSIEKRREPRRLVYYTTRFGLNPEETSHLRGIIINISNSGLCIFSPDPLHRGQEITIKAPLPLLDERFTVCWTNKLLDDFFMVGLMSAQ
jgi:hypothetical protein